MAQFGDSFVIQYNFVVSNSGIGPGIAAASSFKGGGLKSLGVRNGVVPDLHYCSDAPTAVCAWAAHSSAAPDPRPTAVGSGAVWGTNTYWGTRTAQPDPANSWIFGLQP